MKKMIIGILIILILLLYGYNNHSKVDELMSQVIELKKKNSLLDSKVNQIIELNNKNDKFEFKANETISEILKYMQDDNIYKVLYYMNKLSDKDFTSTYGHEEEPYTWYIAAEELGEFGKIAIPYLIENLKTNANYEKGVTLYALLLASQADDVDIFTNGEYIHAGLTFDEENQEKYTVIALDWWEKYKKNFN